VEKRKKAFVKSIGRELATERLNISQILLFKVIISLINKIRRTNEKGN